MQVTIDKNSGYCFGVEFAIKMAEDEMEQSEKLYCLGDIVHNDMEVKRLAEKGLVVIDRDQLTELSDCKVLIRAHGEPPETYKTAIENNIELIDASCPVVLKLQHRVKTAFDKMERENGQIVIYGKKGHAEVIGLTGQTLEKAIVVMEDADLEKIDFNKPVTLFSQTTKSTKGFYELSQKIEERIKAAKGELTEVDFNANDSICRQVSNREPQLQRFAQENDVILFVSGKKSSNGKALYQVCLSENPRSYFIENETEMNPDWFQPTDKVGICGATSTPMWLMEQVKSHLESMEENALLA
ncbi:MAG TPA: 4-hydroxy-3-methylbut-2-enyl diphosphate reductase [Algoriphagus sp.]|jgi:4-hydroxy-3-methylbut-2-enyl diphosphate reductase|uniref:4-hydroxy-3-methylbut-2-enyl diphosphate reductase n=2 Tax=Algoriphagus TaxID=246875 RepID=UPI000C49BDD9|nr:MULTISPECIES: 4-hydroxy-3-methylbut-2-enyl diphosphate reductase [unclassified Algoriphagus]MAL14324.1 4-hydroxy-3-methylbut-2-enyl diphosphate reductase [Algoriphagus sp.]MAN88013.1 4-hydroxy-3-methylbut-2-enyl diphosphate reductase [Algoriphagus sp.]QYH37343.1 4-hydroxy-3-methylbut-2-enyl diphosphate reductase [Algoriphagus sp. NBT04N3]HAH38270.1 4-hydroxy-3-methylbut-2-enyl diphosphate reductase [Algoriphagus sp.]HCB46973.1 4-hydroxy-3-methylbut-2-enyl diphosphate reductase [Algoriphagus|tara:strand:+ start:2691 stop:3587 length:897 start_codon:yes stop_codon:yes gene_type:complete